MTAPIAQLESLVRHARPAVLVTVAAVRGSAPREAGAAMLVEAGGCHGTIGGGHLEYKAIDHARAMLAGGAAGSCLVRFPLGASLGQCCGGVVKLLFEPIDAACAGWIAAAAGMQREGRAWLRAHRIGDAPAASVVLGADEAGEALPVAVRTAARALLGADRGEAGRDEAGRGEAALLTLGADQGDWLLAPSFPAGLHVALFGAGHVGRAIVELLGRLPCRVSWIDGREEEFLPVPPANTRTVVAEAPEDWVADMPADTVYLVLTHDHSLDFTLAERILKRGDFRFFGLIGSQSKRRSFEQRLRHRGFDEGQLARMHCPIGVPGVAGKEPEVIAVAVAAQLMQLRAQSAVAGLQRRRPSQEAPPG
ncbi:xanthine dehydrogenase accessory protein XdhC [Chitinimonas koreensis]|uniref:xanthine dehydrogenase accessory protein XdhC n=1 Tax=Chitinimonas koreensis TaxID=356302 RepID=UPI0004001E5E|nr:xanthine dehydrogenase accessory protein XdhC [Chitinimonas koreensis]QNM94814.1 xanthine dehydrogenase accessory protein XdhC [Chitinimonas koreensis]